MKRLRDELVLLLFIGLAFFGSAVLAGVWLSVVAASFRGPS